MAELRARKLASVLRDVAAAVARDVPPDADCGMVSITEVDVSSDCSQATAYVSSLRNADKAIAYLDAHKFVVKEGLRRRIKIRRIPQVRFVLDERTERGNRIDTLLRENAPENTDAFPASGSD